jgi:hypothetical protein
MTDTLETCAHGQPSTRYQPDLDVVITRCADCGATLAVVTRQELMLNPTPYSPAVRELAGLD